MSTYSHILTHFQLEGQLQKLQAWGGGHINHTYLAEYEQDGHRLRYILQRINQQVFRQPEAVMHNLAVVCTHLYRKWQKAGLADLERKCLQYVPTRQGQAAYVDETGAYWRVLRFIEHSVAIDYVQRPEQAFEAARAFARFQQGLEGLEVTEIRETIPFFHHLGRRYAQFQQALAADVAGRKAGVEAEIELAHQQYERNLPLLQALEQGHIPLRIVHNDTKINNVLLDAHSGQGLCVIDLDTLMPGSLLYDFGDMLRTFTSPVPEDEPDVSRVRLQLPLFEALCRGYLPPLRKLLTPAEGELLLAAGHYMTFIMGLRFLTDYLMGDVYYKTRFPTHNLLRARNQFALIQNMDQQAAAMQRILKEVMR
ncbi:MAG: aminoglycoside phosphotransferase family protein [Bacteroidetes bacterium]|nr:MAG: aminoglycoside phosphotransferase family protein [Bacteroidota bacterium]